MYVPLSDLVIIDRMSLRITKYSIDLYLLQGEDGEGRIQARVATTPLLLMFLTAPSCPIVFVDLQINFSKLS